MATKSKSYTITARNGRVYAATPFSRTFLVEAKRLTGHRWHADTKEWSFPAFQREALESLCADLFDGGKPATTAQPVTAIDRSTRMFGMTPGDVAAIYGGSSMAPDMLTISILSDAQEAMMSGDIETARQLINRAKYGISEYLIDRNGEHTNATTPPNKRQAIAVIHESADHAHHAAELAHLNDAARGEMDAGSESIDFDPEMGF